MGYAVLHLMKPSGGSSPMSAHIERKIDPANADKELKHLNQELIEFPGGVTNRDEAIKHRIDTAGLKRKIGKNQHTSFNIILSGSNNEMNEIESSGKLNNWCSDNVDWLNKTYGTDNVVSVVLHLDEKTPHLHATIVPIVTNERKRRKREEEVKKQYRKKSTNAPRLCIDEVMSREKLKEYQNTYAQAMAKYGLKRGIEGSQARHITTNQYYREVFQQTEVAKDNLSKLEKQQSEAQEELSKVKSDIRKERLKNSASDVGSKLLDGVSSLLGTPKMNKIELENKDLKGAILTLYNENKELKQGLENYKAKAIKEITALESDLKKSIKTVENHYKQREEELIKENNSLKSILNKINELFPYIKEMLHLEGFIRKVGFGTEMIKRLFNREEVSFKGEIYSHEYERGYKTESSVAKLEHDPTSDRPHKFRLNIDGLEVYSWFRQKQKDFLSSIGINPLERKQNRGIRM